MHFHAFNTQSKDIQKDIHAGNLNKDNLHIKIYFVTGTGTGTGSCRVVEFRKLVFYVSSCHNI